MRGKMPRGLLGCADGARLQPVEESGERESVGLGRGLEPGQPRGPGGDGAQDAAAACHLPQQKDARRGKEQVGRPYREEGRQPALTAQRDAGGGEKVVDEDQQDGEDEAGALAAAARSHAQRNAHQHQHQAGGGKGKAVVAARSGIAWRRGSLRSVDALEQGASMGNA